MRNTLRRVIVFMSTTILATSLALTSVKAESVSLTDVKSNHWAYATIQWAVNNGVVKGYPDGTFKPSKNVSEAEFLMMFISAYQKISSTAGQTHWADPVYDVAFKLNWPVKGVNNDAAGKVARDMAVTRGQVANIIAGANGINYMGNDAIQYLLNTNLSSGKTDATIEGYRANDYLTRAEAVVFIKRALDQGLTELKERPIIESSIANHQGNSHFSTETKELLTAYINTLKDSKIIVSADINSKDFKSKYNSVLLQKTTTSNYISAGSLAFQYGFEEIIQAIAVIKTMIPIKYNFQDLIYYHLAYELQTQVEEVGNYIIVVQMNEDIQGYGSINLFKKLSNPAPSTDTWDLDHLINESNRVN